MISVSDLKRKFRPAWPHLDERTRRIMAATEAMSLGYGGDSLVSRACGLSRKAIRKGIRELEGRGKPIVGRIRRPKLYGWGGVSAVSSAIGMSSVTVE
jgi:hypothetical protein